MGWDIEDVERELRMCEVRVVELERSNAVLKGALEAASDQHERLEAEYRKVGEERDRFLEAAIYWQQLAADRGLKGDAAWAVWK